MSSQWVGLAAPGGTRRVSQNTAQQRTLTDSVAVPRVFRAGQGPDSSGQRWGTRAPGWGHVDGHGAMGPSMRRSVSP